MQGFRFWFFAPSLIALGTHVDWDPDTYQGTHILRVDGFGAYDFSKDSYSTRVRV